MLYSLFILLLAAAMLGALGYSLYALVRDQGRGDRVFLGLASRIGITLVLLIFLIIGLATGQLSPSAPWDRVHRTPAADDTAAP